MLAKEVFNLNNYVSNAKEAKDKLCQESRLDPQFFNSSQMRQIRRTLQGDQRTFLNDLIL